MLLDKFQYLPGDAWVAANITTINFPVAQLFHLCILGRHDANGDLRRLAQVRAVERNRRNRPTSQSLPGFLAQALEKTIFHHIAHSATVWFTIDFFDPPGWWKSVGAWSQRDFLFASSRSRSQIRDRGSFYLLKRALRTNTYGFAAQTEPGRWYQRSQVHNHPSLPCCRDNDSTTVYPARYSLESFGVFLGDP
jgi:hypothetical protein